MNTLKMKFPKAVITGIGVVSPIGVGVDSFRRSLLQGKSGISYITRFDASDFPVRIAGEIKEDPGQWVDRRELKRHDLYSLFALKAAGLALDDAGITADFLNEMAERTGVLVASGIGGIQTTENEIRKLMAKGPGKISPFLIPKIISNMASGNIAIKYGLKGPNFSITSACASSTHALGVALDLIRMGKADIILAGGSEAPVTPISVAGFASMKALSTRNEEPDKASRPFDQDRDGFVMAEGAAVLVIEREDIARERGARVYAELAGYGFNDDAYHMTQPDSEGTGALHAMKLALDDSGLTPEDIDYINAHGTSTPLNDRIETLAIKNLFGKRAYQLAVSSTKSMTGHMLGAAGAVEAAATALTVFNNEVYPTINLENPDPECDLDYVPDKPRKTNVFAALSNSFGFGGHNACVVIKKYDV